MIFSTKKLDNLAMLEARTLKLRRDEPEGKGHGQGHYDL